IICRETRVFEPVLLASPRPLRILSWQIQVLLGNSMFQLSYGALDRALIRALARPGKFDDYPAFHQSHHSVTREFASINPKHGWGDTRHNPRRIVREMQPVTEFLNVH